MQLFLLVPILILSSGSPADPPTIVFSGASALTSVNRKCTCTAALALGSRLATTSLSCAALDGDPDFTSTAKSKTFDEREWMQTLARAGLEYSTPQQNKTFDKRPQCTLSALPDGYRIGAAAAGIVFIVLLGYSTYQCCKA